MNRHCIDGLGLFQTRRRRCTRFLGRFLGQRIDGLELLQGRRRRCTRFLGRFLGQRCPKCFLHCSAHRFSNRERWQRRRYPPSRLHQWLRLFEESSNFSKSTCMKIGRLQAMELLPHLLSSAMCFPRSKARRWKSAANNFCEGGNRRPLLHQRGLLEYDTACQATLRWCESRHLVVGS